MSALSSATHEPLAALVPDSEAKRLPTEGLAWTVIMKLPLFVTPNTSTVVHTTVFVPNEKVLPDGGAQTTGMSG